MINLKELRIGNVIKRNEKHTENTDTVILDNVIINCFVNQPQSTNGVNAYDYVKITPELLLKLGFKEVRKGAFFHIRLQWNNGLVYIKNEDNDECYYIPNKCEYLHQLQNLIYCLFGIELLDVVAYNYYLEKRNPVIPLLSFENFIKMIKDNNLSHEGIKNYILGDLPQNLFL
jgi:hypothetical protein